MTEHEQDMTSNISEVSPEPHIDDTQIIEDLEKTPEHPQPAQELEAVPPTEKHAIFQQKDWELASQRSADTKPVDMGPDKLQLQQTADTKEIKTITEDPQINAVLESKEPKGLLSKLREMGFGFLNRKPNS